MELNLEEENDWKRSVGGMFYGKNNGELKRLYCGVIRVYF